MPYTPAVRTVNVETASPGYSLVVAAFDPLLTKSTLKHDDSTGYASKKQTPQSNPSASTLRCSLRPSRWSTAGEAIPQTDSQASKTVRFSKTLEEVRIFSQDEAIISTPSNTTPLQDAASSTQPNHFQPPRSRNQDPVRTFSYTELRGCKQREEPGQTAVCLENVYYHTISQQIVGFVAVQNIAYEKWVTVRFTIDDWKLSKDIPSSYVPSSQAAHRNYDLFRFEISPGEAQLLPNTTTPIRMQFCICYVVAGKECWDNNGGENYTLNIELKPTSQMAGSNSQSKRMAPFPHTDETSEGRLSSTTENAKASDSRSKLRTPEAFSKRYSIKNSFEREAQKMFVAGKPARMPQVNQGRQNHAYLTRGINLSPVACI
jgi:hypothetical protein